MRGHSSSPTPALGMHLKLGRRLGALVVDPVEAGGGA